MASAVVLAGLAGLAMPLGAAMAWFTRLRAVPISPVLVQFIVAFGGGALMSAVALVLVPEGLELVPPVWAIAIFTLGGYVFFRVDRAVQKGGGRGAMMMAMLLDYLPEAMALGAMLGTHPETAVLLAMMIFLQNLPEGFASFDELCVDPQKGARLMAGFVFLVAVGPLAAWLGFSVLADMPHLLGGIMLFAGAGILYLVFQDVAPHAHDPDHWSPAMGAVAGFALGMAGQALTG